MQGCERKYLGKYMDIDDGRDTIFIVPPLGCRETVGCRHRCLRKAGTGVWAGEKTKDIPTVGPKRKALEQDDRQHT